MALTSDQKKHLLIGSGIGAATLWVGSWLFGGKAEAAGSGYRRAPHKEHEREHEHERDDDDNGRGEYGRKKHGKHGHGG